MGRPRFIIENGSPGTGPVVPVRPDSKPHALPAMDCRQPAWSGLCWWNSGRSGWAWRLPA